MGDTDRIIVAQTAAKIAAELLVGLPDDHADMDYHVLVKNINDTIWDVSGIDPDAPGQTRSGGGRGRSQPEPSEHTVDIPDALKGPLTTALASLPAETHIVDLDKISEEQKWADVIVWNPDDWYDNRNDPKAPRGGPTFRHKTITDNQGRGIGVWLNGKAAVPEWVQVLLPYRGSPSLAALTSQEEQPF